MSKIEISRIKVEHKLPNLKGNRLELLQLMQSLNTHIPNLDAVIDVGCNEGLFSKTLSMFKGIEVAILFEPNKKLIPKIEKNTNSIKEIFIYNEALSSSVEEVNYHYHQDSQMNSLLKSNESLLERDFFGDREIQVERIKSSTLDYVFKNSSIELEKSLNILLKVDTQGNELDVLKGGVETLKKIKYCLVEYMVSSPYSHKNTLTDLILYMHEHEFLYVGTMSINKRKNFEIGAMNLLFSKFK